MSATHPPRATAESDDRSFLEQKYDGWWGSDRDGTPDAARGHDPDMSANDREEIIAYAMLKETADMTCPIAKQPPESDADLHDTPTRDPVSDPCVHVPIASIVTATADHSRDFGQYPNRKRVNLERGYIVDGPHLEDRPAEELRGLLEDVLLPLWKRETALTDDQARWLLERAMYLKRMEQEHDKKVLAALLKRLKRLGSDDGLIDDEAPTLELDH